jgi:hypothetical protein
MIFVKIEGTISDGRNKSSWIKIVVKNRNIVLVEVNKKGKLSPMPAYSR